MRIHLHGVGAGALNAFTSTSFAFAVRTLLASVFCRSSSASAHKHKQQNGKQFFGPDGLHPGVGLRSWLLRPRSASAPKPEADRGCFAPVLLRRYYVPPVAVPFPICCRGRHPPRGHNRFQWRLTEDDDSLPMTRRTGSNCSSPVRVNSRTMAWKIGPVCIVALSVVPPSMDVERLLVLAQLLWLDRSMIPR